jgi:predicted nucleic acid-binding protein
VILLAQELSDPILLIDETAARREAIRRGLRVTGLLGLLRDAADIHLIDLPDVIRRLWHTSFRMPEALLQQILKSH